ncbi:branched-chain amino acid ABC transporter permease [Brevibacillus massiliensis]|jgi:branched-chain amino acid transport system permease protein|uniref:branched-chain amino acid ABC transporter permease n=1 Tax=Brevibacillus massiliensis TaxID=1118054 RepID=UPI00030FC6DA|nr:branched-chain amino acid ABC transporter permease [Brevibacillus massiliensis]
MSSDLVQLLFSGLTVGGIYALIAVGFVTIYNVNGVINFAQGEFVMVAAMSGAAMTSAGAPLWIACIAAILVSAAVGAVAWRLALYPARYSSDVVLIIITIGLSTTLRGLAQLLWGSSPLTIPPFMAGEPVSFLGAVIPLQDFFIGGIALICMLALFVFFERTAMGSALRACMMNREVSRLMGISPNRMALLSFVLGAGLAGAVGVSVAPVSLATYDMGLMIGLKGFVAAVLGGLVSIPGAVAGGVLLGVLESLGAGLVSSGYKDAIAFLILLLVLIFRPQGILGARSGKRV